jgi:RES domain-containing protein
MRVYRICKAQYAHDLSGTGAERTGGRWNKRGTPMVYTSGSRALCVAEIAVHLPLGIIPKDFMVLTIEIPDSLPIGEIFESKLPKDWNSIPHGEETQETGEDFCRKLKYAVLKVPSAVVEGEFNFLINPRHPDAAKIRVKEVKPFSFDPRLFSR